MGKKQIPGAASTTAVVPGIHASSTHMTTRAYMLPYFFAALFAKTALVFSKKAVFPA